MQRLSNLWRRLSSAVPQGLRSIQLTLPEWNEQSPARGMRLWRNPDGYILSLATSATNLLELSDKETLRRSCRALAESRGGGLIEAEAITSNSKRFIRLIYKRLQLPAYVYTGMLITWVHGECIVWTMVAGEGRTTGLREAVVTADLMKAGKLTIGEYQRGWAQDPYYPAYQGADRRVLRFTSDDESYDERFPQHPLSKVRKVLTLLPNHVEWAVAQM